MTDTPAASHRDLFRQAMDHANRYRDSLGSRAPGAAVGPDALEKLFDGPTPERPEDGIKVLDTLAAAAEAGITSPSSPGFFGWVMGGSHPLGVAADMMTSAWGQNVASYACSPAGATVEKIARDGCSTCSAFPSNARWGSSAERRWLHSPVLRPRAVSY